MKPFLISVSLFLFSLSFTFSQDGTLDESFGTNGTAQFTFFNANSEIFGLVKTADKLYGAGFTKPSTREHFTIARFNLDGTLDEGYGENGLLIFELGTGFSRAETMVLQPDGKLVAGGWARYNNQDQYVIIRLNADGSIDNDFGTDGIVTGEWSTSTFAEDEIYDAAIMPDGRIIVVGRSYNGGNDDGILACFDSNGDPCANFGTNGFHTITFPDGTGWE